MENMIIPIVLLLTNVLNPVYSIITLLGTEQCEKDFYFNNY